ncbi:hypothetical protein KUTeg_000440 [Tegillarca granosa]|uniref:Carbohydrate kinase PfkB domain-containing protein n=1 Tax=Tegillarca granosa TaxID=220873 RepID=A0ABQ9FXJ1_TEGGR|nr:hypothetical protein KUTeg_000440 [Tegillarca granosa]
MIMFRPASLKFYKSIRSLHQVNHHGNRSRLRSVPLLVRQVSSLNQGYILLSEEVKDALHCGKGVVALERLTKSDLEYLADPKTASIKTSRRDYPVVLSKGLNGGTTVSGTMIACHMTGIPIFVTGGIGGVHRNGENSMDISADLTELGRTPVTVISAGIKSILDIGRTLEYLETEGVCVATFGPNKDFPAFFVPKNTNLRLNLNSGMLIGVPIPEKESGNGQVIEENIALIKNNAKIGSQIAVELSNLRKQENENREVTNHIHSCKSDKISRSSGAIGVNTNKSPSVDTGRVVVIGGSIVDFYARVDVAEFKNNGATYPGSVQQTFGGVGRNIADGLSRLGMNPLFLSAIGKDSHCTAYEAYCQHMDLIGVEKMANHSTATYCAVLKESGELMFEDLAFAPLVCIDGNISTEAIEYITNLCQSYHVPVWFEPTDVHKAAKPLQTKVKKGLTYSSPNLNELRSMYTCLTGETVDGKTDNLEAEEMSVDTVLEEAVRLSKVVVKEIPVVMVTLGKHGLMLATTYSTDSLPIKDRTPKITDNVTMDFYPVTKENSAFSKIVSVLNAAVITGILKGYDFDFCVKAGFHAAQLSLQSHRAVPYSITSNLMDISQIKQTPAWNTKKIEINFHLKTLTFVNNLKREFLPKFTKAKTFNMLFIIFFFIKYFFFLNKKYENNMSHGT